jgi:hypothetical protein
MLANEQKKSQCINLLQLEQANPDWCAGFCSSSALTHLIQIIKHNWLIIKCAIAGPEQKSAHPVDQGSVERGWNMAFTCFC